MKSSRREFLKQASVAGVVTLGGTTPQFLNRAAGALQQDQQGRVLVVIQLAGGNDGLNTVIPYENDAYYKSRPGIAIGKQGVLKCERGVGLHPAMTGMKKLFDAGQLAVQQGVGYPHPDRSHFRSMDIWQSARPESENIQDGWLGRSLEEMTFAPAVVPAITMGGDKLPLSLLSSRVTVPVIQDLKEYQLELLRSRRASPQHRRLLDVAVSPGTPGVAELEYVRRTMQTALASAEKIAQVTEGYRTRISYPATGLGNRLKGIAQIMTADLGARIFFTSLGGFDTHSQQGNAHQGLLAELSDAVYAFLQDLQEHGLADRVTVVTFSEFGRRVAENGSLGTDHGAAGPMFIAGQGVRGGIHGDHPSLTDLDEGDLKFHTDFRSVYASLLEDWLQLESESILEAKFSKLSLFDS